MKSEIMTLVLKDLITKLSDITILQILYHEPHNMEPSKDILETSMCLKIWPPSCIIMYWQCYNESWHRWGPLHRAWPPGQ